MEKTVLRMVTSGSVDDGKSTLIGRLLYETNCVPEDQYEAVKKYSIKRGKEDIDLSFLLDGLESEREQGITIDVAYRYFETNKRKFIVADCPGHEQYTRNMVTGASNSDVAMILIDAKNGVLPQSKRHGFLLSLLRIPHLIVVINKMDLVGYSEKRYNQITEEYSDFCKHLNIPSITYIPVSALKGDNITKPSVNMLWYRDQTILDMLESVSTSKYTNDFRFPVQLPIRTTGFRGYAGKITSGSIKENEEVTILPSMRKTSIKSIVKDEKEKLNAEYPQSVILTLKDEIDVSRGDMIVRSNNRPTIIDKLDAMICWMDDTAPLIPHKKYILKHTTRKINAFVRKVYYKIDVNTTHRIETNRMDLNDIGKVHVELSSNIFADKYIENKETGSFILIDPNTNLTVAAGMIKSFNVVSDSKKMNKTLWLTGLPCSGKTTIAVELVKELINKGYNAIYLDGDDVRETLNSDLGFNEADRKENLRRITCICDMLNKKGLTVVASFVSPTEDLRGTVTKNIQDFKMIYVDCSLEECVKRDVKGMYKRAIAGEILSFTGISSPFEPPKNPDIIVNTEKENLQNCVKCIVTKLLNKE